MVGFYSGPPVDSVGEQAAGLDIVPTTAGQVNSARFGEGMADSYFARIFRQDTAANFGATPDMPDYDAMGNITGGVTPAQEGASVLPAEEANAKYGAPGLKFDHPVTESMAQSLHDTHHEQ